MLTGDTVLSWNLQNKDRIYVSKFDASPTILNLEKNTLVIATTWKDKLTLNKKSKKLVQIRGKQCRRSVWRKNWTRTDVLFEQNLCLWIFDERTALQEIFKTGYANWTLVNASLENSWSLWAFLWSVKQSNSSGAAENDSTLWWICYILVSRTKT